MPFLAQNGKKHTEKMACSVCSAEKGNACGDCLSVHYCSRECQKSDWRQHKTLCALFKRINNLESSFKTQEKRLDVVATKLNYVETPCFCCGLQRTALTDVLLPCCGLVVHGLCLTALSDCPQCGDPLENADALYKKATDLISRNKYHLKRGALVPADLSHIYTLHLDAAKQGHVQAQLRVYEAHWMGVIVQRNVDLAIYFLSLAAAHSPTLVSANAKILLGDFYFDKADFARAQPLYYAAMHFFSTLPFKPKSAANLCAKVFNRLGKIMRHHGDTAKASVYFSKAVSFDADNAGYHHDLGVQHAIEGNLDEAEQEQRACLQLNPKHALAQYAVGFLLSKKGDKKAAAYFTRALQLGHFGAKLQLEKLKVVSAR